MAATHVDRPADPGDFRFDGTSRGMILAYCIGGVLVLALAYFLYTQFTAVYGVKVEAPCDCSRA
ncbi:hypothetical protein [Sphingomonas sp. PAMC 26621]|uniref:hypothetical protein n=1 Tax=Sphingomonas sp. PAMC 26621 TaxID=1112213 RepID=UPI0002880674|nr:hypothetical protein [Sphingomonas sp. PAMC 26621]